VLVLAVGVTLNMQHERPGVETSDPAMQTPVQSAPVVTPPAAPAARRSPPAAASDRFEPAMTPQAPAVKSRAARDLSKEAAPATFPQTDQLQRKVPTPPPSAPLKVETPHPEPRPFANSQATPAPASPAAAAPSRPAEAMREAPARAVASEAPAAAQGVAPLRAKREAADAGEARERKDAALEDPAAELERIARLRADGRDADADKAIEDFRRKHPDFLIPPAMWDRVKAR
jgi:hypothetical protein